MALNLLPLPSSTSGKIPEIVSNLRTTWGNFKRIAMAFGPFYYTSLYSSLNELLTEIGTRSATLYLNSAVAISVDTTIPSNVNLLPTPSGSFVIANGVTLTMPLPIAGRFQWIFWTGTGTVAFTRGAGSIFEPEWTGAYKATEVGGAVTVSGTTNLTSFGGVSQFTPQDVGKIIAIRGAGAGGSVLCTSIASYVDPTHVHLSVNASTSVSDVLMQYGPDCTAPLQKAWDISRATHIELNFDAGTYLISSGLSITTDGAGFRWVGHGPDQTLIQAVSNTPFDTMVSITDTDDNTLAASYTNYAARSYIDGVSLNGGGVLGGGHVISTSAIASYGYRGCTNHLTLKNLHVSGTGIKDIDIGYAFSSKVLDVECTGSEGDGICFNRLDNNNAISILRADVSNHIGWGIRVRGGSTLVIEGGGNETNDAGGIYLESNVRGYTIQGMYFESCGSTGWTFTADQSNGAITPLTINSNILINGHPTSTTIGNGSGCSGSVLDHRTSMGGALYHIFAPGQNGLIVEGIELSGSDTGYLVGQYGNPNTSAPSPIADLSNIRIGVNPGWEKASSGLFKMVSMGYDVLSVDPSNVFISDASNRNIAETDMGQWILKGAVGGGTWARSAQVCPFDERAAVYELTLAATGSSDSYGFRVDASLYPQYWGKYFVFSCLVMHTEVSDLTAIIEVGASAVFPFRLLTMDYNTGTAVGWKRQALIFQFPSSGVIDFAVQKVTKNAGAAGAIYISSPVMCEYGSNHQTIEGIRKIQAGDYLTASSPSITSPTIATSLTASYATANTAAAFDASKKLVSLANTGSGSNVLAQGPALTGTTTVAALTASALVTANLGVAIGGGSDVAGKLYYRSDFGIALRGKTATDYDLSLLSNAGAYLLRNKTGVAVLEAPNRFSMARGADIASANDLTLGTDGNSFGITGTTNINGIATANFLSGAQVKLFLKGAITVKHNTAPSAGFAKFKLQGAADFVGASGAVLTVEFDGTDWQETARRTA